MQKSNGKYRYIFIKLKKNSVQSQKGDKPGKVAQAWKPGFMGGWGTKITSSRLAGATEWVQGQFGQLNVTVSK